MAQQLTSAIAEVLLPHNKQLLAVIHGKTQFAAFDEKIRIAMKRKDQAKTALLAHIQQRDCAAREGGDESY